MGQLKLVITGPWLAFRCMVGLLYEAAEAEVCSAYAIVGVVGVVRVVGAVEVGDNRPWLAFRCPVGLLYEAAEAGGAQCIGDGWSGWGG